MSNSRAIYIERALLESAALKAIKSVHSVKMLLEFYSRRQMVGIKEQKGRGKRWVIANNGQIVFTYDDAEQLFGIKQATVSRCFDELYELGFVDVSEKARGLEKKPTLWAISDRWKAFGTVEFEKKKRPKIPQRPFPSRTVRKKQLSCVIGHEREIGITNET
jgi:hypothetical protein